MICCLGQGIGDIVKLISPAISPEDTAAWVCVILIGLSAFFTAIGAYDRLGAFAGGGSIIPITGFANSVVSPAIEYNREGIVFGMCSKMFAMAGPVIVCGVVSGIIVGIIELIKQAAS